MSIFLSSATDACVPLDWDVLIFDSDLLASSQEKQDVVAEGKELSMKPSQPACRDLPWKHEKPQLARGRIDKRLLADHSCPVPVSLPSLTDLHAEVLEETIFVSRLSLSPCELC